MNGVTTPSLLKDLNSQISPSHVAKKHYFEAADLSGNTAIGMKRDKKLFPDASAVARQNGGKLKKNAIAYGAIDALSEKLGKKPVDTSAVAKDKGHGGSEGHTHEQISSTKQLPLREQKATGTDSFAIKMHQGYKLHHGGIEGNWSDIAKEAIKTYPNIDPAGYDLKDVSKHNAKEGRQKYNLGL